MASQHFPDRWIIIEVKHSEGIIKKILSGWYGGYLNSDSWRLSSGITKIIEHEKQYEIHNESGSIYACQKGAYGLSGLMSGVLATYKKQAEELGSVEIRIVDVEELKNE